MPLSQCTELIRRTCMHLCSISNRLQQANTQVIRHACMKLCPISARLQLANTQAKANSDAKVQSNICLISKLSGKQQRFPQDSRGNRPEIKEQPSQLREAQALRLAVWKKINLDEHNLRKSTFPFSDSRFRVYTSVLWDVVSFISAQTHSRLFFYFTELNSNSTSVVYLTDNIFITISTQNCIKSIVLR